MNATDPSSHPGDDDLPAPGDSADPGAGQSRDRFDEWLAEMDREFGASATPEPDPPRAPEEIARDEAIAAYLNGRVCIYLEKSLLLPVQVESATADSRAIRVVCLTRPRDPGKKPRRFSVGMPLSSASAFSIELDGGYGINATLVHAPEAVAAIERWILDGGSPGDLVSAIRCGAGLPPEVEKLLHLPFDPGAAGPASGGEEGVFKSTRLRRRRGMTGPGT